MYVNFTNLLEFRSLFSIYQIYLSFVINMHADIHAQADMSV